MPTDKKTTTIHDSGYKRLLANKTIFRQLIETLVEEDWVAKLDFEWAERLDKSFVSEHYKETEADIIYKVPLRDSETFLYICLLIEFQSTVYRFMVLRSLQYVCDFYMDFVLSNKSVRGLKLPAMFPIVLYNGDDPWTAPDTMAELIENTIDLGEYGLHFKHFVIAENEFGKDWLLQIRNIISTLFLAEAHYDYELLRDELLHLCDNEQDTQAVELFINWLRQLAQHGRINQADFAQMEAQYRTREEMKSMLVKALEQEREMLYNRGKEDAQAEMQGMFGKALEESYGIGKQEGIDIGKQEGIDIGKQEGIDKGIDIGVEQAHRQIVRAMSTNGFAVEIIAQLLARPVSEVTRLLTELEPAMPQPTSPQHDAGQQTISSSALEE